MHVHAFSSAWISSQDKNAILREIHTLVESCNEGLQLCRDVDDETLPPVLELQGLRELKAAVGAQAAAAEQSAAGCSLQPEGPPAAMLHGSRLVPARNARPAAWQHRPVGSLAAAWR